MIKQWIVPGILIVAIIIGLLGYSFYKRTSQHGPTGLSTPTSSTATQGVPTKLSNVLHTGKTQKCTLQSGNQTIETYYMNGLTVRADFLSPTTKQTVHLLADGSLAYIWVGSETKGSSMPESDTKSINTAMQTDGLPGFYINAKRNVQCAPWKSDPAVLGAPYTVVFTPVK